MIDIVDWKLYTKADLLNVMRNTYLLSDKLILPFKNSDISVGKVSRDLLFPTQKFVLNEQLKKIENLYNFFDKQGVYIPDLQGFLSYKVRNVATDFVLTPPIVEVIEGKPLLIDGMHRSFFFGNKNLKFNAIFIEGIEKQYFPYQLQNPKGWDDVIVFDKTLPLGFVRKDMRYEDKEKKKALFRQYPFPGVIKIVREHSGR